MSKRGIVEEALKEKRRFRRIRLTKNGKVYFPDSGQEVQCQLEDISVGGAFLHCEFLRQPGGQAVVYLDELGRFEGPITAVKKDAFTMAFTCSRLTRHKLADRLTIEINRHLLENNVAS